MYHQMLFTALLHLFATSNYDSSNDVIQLQPTPHNELISFKSGAGNNESWGPWVNQLSSFLEHYRLQTGHNILPCSPEYLPRTNHVCYVDIKTLGDKCTAENNFGYPVGSPCIFINTNKIVNWIPDVYSSNDLPEEMPQFLNAAAQTDPEAKNVWLSCEGMSPADKENVGPIAYSPQPGFPSYFFPYNNTVNYLSPLVSIQFLKPTRGVIINIECRAWAKNIGSNRMEKRDRLKFELLVD